MPSGPVRKTSTARLKLCSCSMSSVNMTNSISGAPAAIEPVPLLLSAAAPASWMRQPGGMRSSSAFICGTSSLLTVGPCSPSTTSPCTVMA